MGIVGTHVDSLTDRDESDLELREDAETFYAATAEDAVLEFVACRWDEMGGPMEMEVLAKDVMTGEWTSWNVTVEMCPEFFVTKVETDDE
jgi:hypothetical protein